MNVLGLVRKELNIDEKRIYLLGHSMGGGGTWHLGIKYPDVWAALAPIAPAIYRSPDELEKIKHMPVIVVQGARDFLVRAERTRRWVEKMKELRMDYTYIEDPDGGHVTVAFDNLPKIFDFFNQHRKKAKPVE
jgi:predicted peptidase